jgi:hypothetical protein
MRQVRAMVNAAMDCLVYAGAMEHRMLREQMINFLQTTVVFPLLTNAASVVVAAYAIRIAKALAAGHEGPRNATARKLDALLLRVAA